MSPVSVEAYLLGDADAVRAVEVWIEAELRANHASLHHEHEDLAQSVHQKLVWQLREGRFRGDSSLKTYVTRITRHTAADAARRGKTRAKYSTFEGESSVAPSRRLERHQAGKIALDAFKASDPMCREMWKLILVDGLSYEKMAERLAIRPGTVKYRMWECRKRLRRSIRRAEQGEAK